MSQKKKVIVSLVLFVLIFGVLLSVATFKDFEISCFLTRNTLAEHTYNTNCSVFGTVAEVIGSSPVYLIAGFALNILYWYGLRIKKGIPGKIMAIMSAVISLADYYVFSSDTFGYLKAHVTVGGTILDNEKFLTAVFGIIAVALTLAGTLAVKNFSKEQTKMLFGFCIACLVLTSIPTILINYVLKEPFGRIRFRAMNMYPDNPEYGFAAFSRWYEIKGQWLDKETRKQLFHASDALMSFPSGHTAGAAMSYGIIMLIDALKIESKKIKTALWVCPVVFTTCVAYGRMLIGAHFMSDVLIASTMCFVTMIVSREIFVCKGSNLKALAGK